MTLTPREVTATKPARILVHGQPGVGKTTLATQFPCPVFLQTEDGAPSGVTLESFGALSAYEQVCEAVTLLASLKYLTLVVDTLDELEPLIWKAVCAENGWPSIEAPGSGKGYVIVDSFWQDFLRGLDWLRCERGMTILFLAHSQVETVNDPRAPSYSSYQLRLHRRARALVQDWCDAIGFLATDVHTVAEDQGFNKKRVRADGGNARWLHWEGRPAFVAKNRYGLPARMPCPPNFDFKELSSFLPPRQVDEIPLHVAATKKA